MKKSIVLIMFVAIAMVGCTTIISVPEATTNNLYGLFLGDVIEKDLGDARITSIKIQDQTSGHSIVIGDEESIESIIKLLKEILFLENLGTEGYTLGGYVLYLYSEKAPIKVGVNLSKKYGNEFFIGWYEGHYYKIDGDDIDKELYAYFNN